MSLVAEPKIIGVQAVLRRHSLGSRKEPPDAWPGYGELVKQWTR